MGGVWMGKRLRCVVLIVRVDRDRRVLGGGVVRRAVSAVTRPFFEDVYDVR